MNKKDKLIKVCRKIIDVLLVVVLTIAILGCAYLIGCFKYAQYKFFMGW